MWNTVFNIDIYVYIHFKPLRCLNNVCVHFSQGYSTRRVNILHAIESRSSFFALGITSKKHVSLVRRPSPGQMIVLWRKTVSRCFWEHFTQSALKILTLYKQVHPLTFNTIKSWWSITYKYGVTSINFKLWNSNDFTLMVHSPWQTRAIIMVPPGHCLHNPPWMTGTSILWSKNLYRDI